MTLGIASGQQPRRAPPDPLPILPVEQAWLVVMDMPTSAGGAMDDRHVYVPLQNGELLALARETGQTIWTRPLQTALPPLAHEGVVYVATPEELHALDAATGDTRWQVTLEQPIAVPLTVDTGWLIAVAANGVTTAYRAADGEALWEQQMGARPRSGAVFGEGDWLYMTLADGRVGALKLLNGEVAWETRLPGALSPPCASGGRVFVGSDDNFFYALEAARGRLAWKWRSGGDVIGAAAHDDVVFIASLDNIIRAVNRGNGNQRWRKDTGSRPVIPPLAFADIAIVIGISNTLTAFSAKAGQQVGTYVAPGDLQGPPLIDPMLQPFKVAAAVVTRDGRVAGLRPVAMLFRDQPAVALTALPGKTMPREQAPRRAPRPPTD
jgi:outer membrane protein assembly factor BamB